MSKVSITINTEVEDKDLLNNVLNLLEQGNFAQARFDFIGRRNSNKQGKPYSLQAQATIRKAFLNGMERF